MIKNDDAEARGVDTGVGVGGVEGLLETILGSVMTNKNKMSRVSDVTGRKEKI